MLELPWQGAITHRRFMKMDFMQLDAVVTIGLETCHALVVGTYVSAITTTPSQFNTWATTQEVKHSPISSPVRISVKFILYWMTDRPNKHTEVANRDNYLVMRRWCLASYTWRKRLTTTLTRRMFLSLTERHRPVDVQLTKYGEGWTYITKGVEHRN